MSQRRESANPPARAGPLTAATMGRRHSPIASKATVLVSTSFLRWSRSPPNWSVSIPEQKAGPAPVSTMQPTSVSSERRLKASAISKRSSIERAFRLSGRRSVTTATSPRRSIESRPCPCATGGPYPAPPHAGNESGVYASGGAALVLPSARGARGPRDADLGLTGPGPMEADLRLETGAAGTLRDRYSSARADRHTRPFHRHDHAQTRAATGGKIARYRLAAFARSNA